MEKEKFVVALLSFIKPIGYVLLPYSCFIENENFITIHERLTALNISTYPGLAGAETQFCKVSETFSNQALIKQFSKKNQTPKEFFPTLDKKLLDEMIRPFVERKLAKIIDILLANNIPLYNGNGSSHLYPADRIVIEKECPEARLKFTRTGEGTQYKLSVFHHNQNVDLKNPDNKVLVNDPCCYVAGNTLLRFNETINGKLLTPFKTKDFVAIPKSFEYKYFSTFIRKIANRCDIEAEGFQVNDLQDPPSTILSLEVNWQGRLVLVVHFQYGDKVILANNPQKTFTSLLADENGFIFNRIKRHLVWEAAQIAFLKARNLKQVEATFLLNEEGPANKSYRLIEWLSDNRSDLSLHAFSIQQQAHIKYLLEVPVLNLNLKTGPDWFDIYGTVILKEFEIPFIKFKNHIINNIKEYELPTDEIVILPDEWFSRFQDLMLHAQEHKQFLRLRKHQFMLLPETLKADKQQLNDALLFPETVELPDISQVELRPYQVSGFYWMHALRKEGLGGILADDMGLGKTLQTITLLASLYPKKEWAEDRVLAEKYSSSAPLVVQLDLFAQPVTGNVLPEPVQSSPATVRPPCSLIVLPASLIHNWLNELSRFAPWLRVYIHTGLNRIESTASFKRFDIVLTTYGTMRNDIEMLSTFTFGYIVLDESQTIKNPASKGTQAAFALQGQHRMVLTGTPIQNSLTDIWSQFNFLNQGMLGTYGNFVKYFASPLAKNQEDPAGKKLKIMIRPFILRRTKEEVAKELPPLTETSVLCDMTEDQKSIYDTEKSKIRNLLLEKFEEDGIEKSSVMVLKSLTLLRQLANHPRMTDQGSEAGSGKFREVTESLETVLAENHKVLVFSSFVKHLNLLGEYCTEKGINYALLTGSTTHREKVINSFKNKSEIQLFLISLKAGGVGLNLTEADYVFILDPWWNPAAEMQAMNRAHRIGQDKKVFVYRFITKDTVEEKIMQLQQRKKDLADLFVTSDSTIAGMTRDEIMAIFD